MKVVLWDIDGTILSTDGAGRRAVNRAIHEVYGVVPSEKHDFDGKTDPLIVRELMALAGLEAHVVEAGVKPALDRYVSYLRDELKASEGRHLVYPGVLTLLDEMEAHDDILLGLLTGNVRAGAMAKLDAVGIRKERFLVGAFGSDAGLRPALPAIARDRAEVHLRQRVESSDIVIIGDTPADMSCGNGIGARAIGVATGRYTVDDLNACNGAAVFADLSDTKAVMRAIING